MEFLMLVLVAALIVALVLSLASRLSASVSPWETLRKVPGWAIVLGGAVGLIALSFLADSPVPFFFLVIGAVVLFAVTWLRDFAYLMTQPDSAFPGRYDKVIWAFLLIVLPPVGMLAFWSYRRAHAAEGKPAGSVEWL